MAIWVIISLVAALLEKGKPFDTSGSEAHFRKGKIVVRKGDFHPHVMVAEKTNGGMKMINATLHLVQDGEKRDAVIHFDCTRITSICQAFL
jgi:hypothetical protein